jgi:ABC-type glycerol-3-phosphate transport system substrate-binding protein
MMTKELAKKEAVMLRTMILTVLLNLAVVSAMFAGGSGQQSAESRLPFTGNEGTAYAGFDLSKPVTIYLYMLGDIPADMDEVMGIANREYFQKVLNTTVVMEFLGWSDYETKYPLILAGGDDVDIIYTSVWAFYDQEARKESFVELTEDFRNKWMPNIMREQLPASWPQVAIDGKIYSVPKTGDKITTKLWAIREDLREKHNIPKPTDWASLKNYFFTIAANEKGLQAYASAKENEELQASYWAVNSIGSTNYPVFFSWKNEPRHDPVPEELVFQYLTDYYTDFALEMWDWHDHGVWSRNVMNNTVPVSDAFVQGTSAGVFWTEVVFTLGKNMEANGVGKVGYYDLTPTAAVGRPSIFNGDCWAIASSSPNKERAALVIDMMKTDDGLRNLLQGGVEGRHYILQSKGKLLPGPEAADYPFNSWAWTLNSPEMLTIGYNEDTHPDEKRIMESLVPRAVDSNLGAFRFDISPVAIEWAVISSLIEEYTYSFECGIFGNQTLTKLQEFRDKLKAAGSDKLTVEFRKQYAQFLTTIQ